MLGPVRALPDKELQEMASSQEGGEWTDAPPQVGEHKVLHPEGRSPAPPASRSRAGAEVRADPGSPLPGAPPGSHVFWGFRESPAPNGGPPKVP